MAMQQPTQPPSQPNSNTMGITKGFKDITTVTVTGGATEAKQDDQEVTLDAIETLITDGNITLSDLEDLLGTIDTDTGAIKTAVEGETPAGENHLGSIGGNSANPEASFNRPDNLTAYTSGDLLANSTIPAGVVAMQFTSARIATGSFTIMRARLHKASKDVVNAKFRLHLFNQDPVAIDPTFGDNGIMSINGITGSGFLGSFDYDMTSADVSDILADGISMAAGPIKGNSITVKLASGSVVWGLLEARDTYTPDGPIKYTCTLEILQD